METSGATAPALGHQPVASQESQQEGNYISSEHHTKIKPEHTNILWIHACLLRVYTCLTRCLPPFSVH
jgi:hypothetical protein